MIDVSKEKYEGKSDAPNVESKGIVTQGQGAVGLLGIYSSEITLLEGGEHIRTVKLSDKRNVPLRCYAACCGTPLGGIDGALCFIYPALIHPNPHKTQDQVDFAEFKPFVNFYTRSAPEGYIPPEGCKAAKTFTAGAVAKFLVKLSTALFHKDPDNALINTTSKIEPTIGIDTIELEE